MAFRMWFLMGALALAGCEGSGLGSGLHRHRQQAYYMEEPGGPIEKAQSMTAVIERINSNSASMDFLLRGGGVTAKGEHMEGRKPESYELKGTLLYRKPRDLYLQLQHALGGKMEIGSNRQEFWVWKRLGKDRYWWGEQASVDANQELDIPLRPTDIVEVLGLGELSADSVKSSDFSVKDNRYEISVRGRDSAGRSYTAKNITIDRREPHLVREMEYLYPDGRKRVVAYLSQYSEVDGSSVFAPRHVQIMWPERGGNMDLEFATMQRFDSGEAANRFTSPIQRGRDVGRMERVDQPGQASAGSSIETER